ncbi:MAG: SpoIIE family protein phosphatase [Candidatus Kapabacteria bacterium]|nr:SpoIIE family protein phosphatase [Ignavibacteriota bacterium]MCW5885070.1 SpoIIE family protein phosphatase [Candidatus Kapabacteria bacterium]
MSKYNKIIFLVAGIIFFLVRLTGDLLLYSLDMSSGSTAILWYFITSIAILVSFGYYYLKGTTDKLDQENDTSGDAFLNSLYQTFVLSLIIVLLVIFFSFKDTSALFKRSYIGLILADFFYIYTVIVIYINFQFTYKWLSFRRHRLTRFYLFVIAFLIAFILANEAASVFFDLEFQNWLKVLSSIIFLSIFLFAFLANKKTAWVASLARNQRTKYFWLILLNIIIVIKLLLETGDENSLIFGSFSEVYPFTLSLLSISFLIYGVFLFRIFMSILAVMPSSVIVERKSSEINTLTYLNKVVAESANNDRQTLIDTVTNLALQASSAYGAWTEIYENNVTEIQSCVNVENDAVRLIHEKLKIDKYFQSLSKSILVESVKEIKELQQILKYVPNAKSLIIVPLITSRKREGTLVIFDSEDFAFEPDDLNILSAFGDNVKIALENSRLLRESVEKERYRNEMMLARTMQNKLLPQKLYQPINYSISAYSIPAQEVGGDYYDLVKLKNGTDCVLIGDVSGKGISAAFYMAQLKGVVLSKSLESDSPAELLCKINSTLHKNMESQMFITMSAVSLCLNSSKVKMARAGHMPFFVKASKEVIEYTPKGLGIGLTGESIFNSNMEEIEIELSKDDKLLLFTDGLNEIRNQSGEEFGIENLKVMILRNDLADTEKMIYSIRDYIDNFAGSAKIHDDMTLIILSRK